MVNIGLKAIDSFPACPKSATPVFPRWLINDWVQVTFIVRHVAALIRLAEKPVVVFPRWH